MVSYKELRAMGLNLIPCRPKSKMPAIAWKEFQTRKCTAPLDENGNAAVICGKVSGGIAVIDIDSPELIEKTLRDFESIKQNTLVVETGSGGVHIYVKPKTRVNTMRLTNRDGEHMDIQCEGVYVVAPNGTHPNGNKYKVISDVTTISDFDLEGWIKTLRTHGFNPEGSGLKPIYEIAKGIGSGERNNSAFKYICHLFSKVEMTPDQAWSEALQWNKRNNPPMDKQELKAVYESALKRADVKKPELVNVLKLNSQHDAHTWLKKHIGDKYDWSGLLNTDNFVLNIDVVEIQEILIKYPSTFLEIVREVLDEYGINNKLELTMEPTVTMQEITPKMGDDIICFDCEIIAAEERMSYTKEAEHECLACGNIRKIKCNELRTIPTTRCNCKKKGLFRIIEGPNMDTDYVQKLYVRESMETARNSTPVNFTVEVFGDLVGEAYVGQKKRIVGQIYSIPHGRYNDLVIKCISIEDLENLKVTLPTEEELHEWRELIKEDGFFDKLVEMFAPDVTGYQDPKKILLLSLAGAVKTKNKVNNIHVLFIGDPGTAKTTLLERTLEIAFKSILTSGKGNSAAGLTGGLDRAGPNMPLVFLPGALTLANKGIAGIDEMDKMASNDRSSVHNCMAKGNIPINKVNIHGILPADTTIIATANPKGDKWVDGKGIIEQINLSQTLLSRFDAIWLFQSTVDEYVDRKISTHVMNQMSPNTESLQDVPKLMNFINFIKTINPELNEESKKKITEFYVKVRKLSLSQSMIPIDPRKTEGIARMSMAHARIHMRNTVEEKDVDEAIRLFTMSLETFGLDPEGGESQLPLFNKKKMKKEDIMWETIQQAEGEEGGDFDLDMVEEILCKTEYYTKESAKKELLLWEKAGRLLRNPDGTYRKA